MKDRSSQQAPPEGNLNVGVLEGLGRDGSTDSSATL
jgi:hypothetical protein